MIVNCHPHHPHLKGRRPRKNKLAIVKKQFGKKLGKTEKKIGEKVGKKTETIWKNIRKKWEQKFGEPERKVNKKGGQMLSGQCPFEQFFLRTRSLKTSYQSYRSHDS